MLLEVGRLVVSLKEYLMFGYAFQQLKAIIKKYHLSAYHAICERVKENYSRKQCLLNFIKFKLLVTKSKKCAIIYIAQLLSANNNKEIDDL